MSRGTLGRGRRSRGGAGHEGRFCAELHMARPVLLEYVTKWAFQFVEDEELRKNMGFGHGLVGQNPS